MLTLLFLLVQATPQRSIEEAVAAFAKGETAAREEVLKAGIGSVLALRKVREQAPEPIDSLIFDIKSADGAPAKETLEALKGVRAMELGQVGFEVAVDELSRDFPLLLDPALFKTHWGRNITLNLKERPRRQILETICRQTGLDYGFFYGAVLIAPAARLWPAAPARYREAPLSAEETDRAGKLVQRLGSDDYQDREEAQAALRKLGKGIIPLLEKGAQGEDAERRSRCTALVKAFTEPPPQAVFHRPAAAQQKLTGADDELRKRLFTDMISFKVADIILDGAMKLMLQPRAIPFQLSPALMGARVTLDAQNQSAWAVLSLATHYGGCDFMIQNGQLLIDSREEIQQRLAAEK